jgi:hypothetical protein
MSVVSGDGPAAQARLPCGLRDFPEHVLPRFDVPRGRVRSAVPAKSLADLRAACDGRAVNAFPAAAVARLARAQAADAFSLIHNASHATPGDSLIRAALLASFLRPANKLPILLIQGNALGYRLRLAAFRPGASGPRQGD